MLAAISISIGCASPAANTSNQQASPTNQNVNAANTAAAPAPSASPVAAVTEVGANATPSEVYKAAHKMRQEKDYEGLKKIFAADVLDFFTEIGKADGKTVDDGIREMFNRPQAEKAEVRNEKINGDRATVEYLDETGEWDTMDFRKEGGVWKITFPDMEMGPDKEKKGGK